MLQCVAVCCSVVQCVAVCCSVLQCVAVCCSVLQCVAVRRMRKETMRRNQLAHIVLQCVAVCCSALQCVAVCFSVLQSREIPGFNTRAPQGLCVGAHRGKVCRFSKNESVMLHTDTDESCHVRLSPCHIRMSHVKYNQHLLKYEYIMSHTHHSCHI